MVSAREMFHLETFHLGTAWPWCIPRGRRKSLLKLRWR